MKYYSKIPQKNSIILSQPQITLGLIHFKILQAMRDTEFTLLLNMRAVASQSAGLNEWCDVCSNKFHDKYRDCDAACSTFRCRSLLSSSGFICSY